MLISLVVAASANNVIGKENKLLWHLPNDLAFFENITWGLPVIMGRKTFESMNTPLKGRTNIVITRSRDWKAEGAIVAPGIEEAIKIAEADDVKQCSVIGGGEIYKQAMPLADRIYITRVHAEFDGDAYFPEIDESVWIMVSNEDFRTDSRHAYAYSFQVWEKRP